MIVSCHDLKTMALDDYLPTHRIFTPMKHVINDLNLQLGLPLDIRQFTYLM